MTEVGNSDVTSTLEKFIEAGIAWMKSLGRGRLGPAFHLLGVRV
jgi:hypothetical protein